MVAENSIVCLTSGHHPEHPLDVRQEAEVEHLVGLVEHQDADRRRAPGCRPWPGRAAGRACRRPRRRRPAGRRSAARRRGRRRRRSPMSPVYRAASCRSRVTWTHSSRVGTMTSARGARPVAIGCAASAVSAASRCSSGTPKPSVLPMPVRAWPIRSEPIRATGRVSAWMAKVRSMPACVERLDDARVDLQVGERGCLRLDRGVGGERVGFGQVLGDQAVLWDRFVDQLLVELVGRRQRWFVWGGASFLASRAFTRGEAGTRSGPVAGRFEGRRATRAQCGRAHLARPVQASLRGRTDRSTRGTGRSPARRRRPGS